MISQAKNSTNFKKAVSFFKDYEKNQQKQQQITKSDMKKKLLKKRNRINFLQNHQMQTSSQNLRFILVFCAHMQPHRSSRLKKKNEKLLHTYTHKDQVKNYKI